LLKREYPGGIHQEEEKIEMRINGGTHRKVQREKEPGLFGVTRGVARLVAIEASLENTTLNDCKKDLKHRRGNETSVWGLFERNSFHQKRNGRIGERCSLPRSAQKMT